MNRSAGIQHGRYQIGGFWFDVASGELASSASPARASRLAPKPARLLAKLIECDGGLLTHEQIRDELWPDVQVEFDQSVHFCVRQIRSALGDVASDPKYIETLPRRGYRLLVTPVQIAEAHGLPAESSAPAAHHEGTPRPATPQRMRTTRATALAALLIVAIACAFGLSGGGRAAASMPRVRIAVMPFTPSDGTKAAAMQEAATHLVGLLGNDTRIAIVGPSTTSRFDRSESPLSDTARELGVAYIVNGRFAKRDGEPAMLAELIRTSDGAHVWVRWWSLDDPPENVASVIASAVHEHITDQRTPTTDKEDDQ